MVKEQRAKRSLSALRYMTSEDLEKLAQSIEELGKAKVSGKVIDVINAENKKIHYILEKRTNKFQQISDMDPGFIKDVKDGRFGRKKAQEQVAMK